MRGFKNEVVPPLKNPAIYRFRSIIVELYGPVENTTTHLLLQSKGNDYFLLLGE